MGQSSHSNSEILFTFGQSGFGRFIWNERQCSTLFWISVLLHRHWFLCIVSLVQSHYDSLSLRLSSYVIPSIYFSSLSLFPRAYRSLVSHQGLPSLSFIILIIIHLISQHLFISAHQHNAPYLHHIRATWQQCQRLYRGRVSTVRVYLTLCAIILLLFLYLISWQDSDLSSPPLSRLSLSLGHVTLPCSSPFDAVLHRLTIVPTTSCVCYRCSALIDSHIHRDCNWLFLIRVVIVCCCCRQIPVIDELVIYPLCVSRRVSRRVSRQTSDHTSYRTLHAK